MCAILTTIQSVTSDAAVRLRSTTVRISIVKLRHLHAHQVHNFDAGFFEV